MRETTADPAPSLYDELVDSFGEDTDPYGRVPFTIAFEPTVRAPGPPRLRTHEEYQRARAADKVTRQYASQRGIRLTLDVGAWVPDELLEADDTVVVDVHTLVAAQRLIR